MDDAVGASHGSIVRAVVGDTAISHRCDVSTLFLFFDVANKAVYLSNLFGGGLEWKGKELSTSQLDSHLKDKIVCMHWI